MKKVNQVRIRKDFLIITLMVVCSIIVYSVLRATDARDLTDVGTQIAKMGPIPLYIAVGGSLITLVVSYFESKDNDPFVTGRTQNMGIANSFLASPFFIVLLSFYLNLVVVCIMYLALFMIARVLGQMTAWNN